MFFLKIRIKNKKASIFDLIDQVCLSYKLLKYCDVLINIEYNINSFNYLSFLYLNNLGIILNNHVNNIDSRLIIGDKFNYLISIKLRLFKYLLKVR